TSSAEATKQIHARIRGIQNETNNVVITIEHSTQQVVLQSELAAEAGSALEEVDSVMRRIVDAIGDMNAIATEQADVAVNASQAIAAIAQISTQTRDSMQQMRGAMDHLVELAHSLLRSIGVFRLGNATQSGGVALLPPGDYAAPEQATLPMAALGSASSGRLPSPPATPGVAKGGVTSVLPRTSAPLHPPVAGMGSLHPETNDSLPPLPLSRTTSSLPPLHEEGSGTLRREAELWSGDLRRD
ncbi:MAG: hypothetical protein ACRDHP_09705, partial [Ktedonobacterales bacterium]